MNKLNRATREAMFQPGLRYGRNLKVSAPTIEIDAPNIVKFAEHITVVFNEKINSSSVCRVNTNFLLMYLFAIIVQNRY